MKKAVTLLIVAIFLFAIATPAVKAYVTPNSDGPILFYQSPVIKPVTQPGKPIFTPGDPVTVPDSTGTSYITVLPDGSLYSSSTLTASNSSTGSANTGTDSTTPTGRPPVETVPLPDDGVIATPGDNVGIIYTGPSGRTPTSPPSYLHPTTGTGSTTPYTPPITIQPVGPVSDDSSNITGGFWGAITTVWNKIISPITAGYNPPKTIQPIGPISDDNSNPITQIKTVGNIPLPPNAVSYQFFRLSNLPTPETIGTFNKQFDLWFDSASKQYAYGKMMLDAQGNIILAVYQLYSGKRDIYKWTGSSWQYWYSIDHIVPGFEEPVTLNSFKYATWSEYTLAIHKVDTGNGNVASASDLVITLTGPTQTGTIISSNSYTLNIVQGVEPYNVSWSTDGFKSGTTGLTSSSSVTAYYAWTTIGLKTVSVYVVDANGKTATASINVNVTGVAPKPQPTRPTPPTPPTPPTRPTPPTPPTDKIDLYIVPDTPPTPPTPPADKITPPPPPPPPSPKPELIGYNPVAGLSSNGPDVTTGSFNGGTGFYVYPGTDTDLRTNPGLYNQIPPVTVDPVDDLLKPTAV
jgi:hypothetical protein